MDVFTLSQPRMHKGSFVREYGACPSDTLLLRNCYVKLPGEVDELHRELVAEGAPDDALRVYPDRMLAGHPAFPWRLGRMSLLPASRSNEQAEQGERGERGIREAVLHTNAHNPLLWQLRALHAVKAKRHYRIAIVNGFGGKLGDTLVGTTAFRHVRKLIGSILPGFSCDMLVGLIISNGNIRECYKFGEMANMVFLGPSVEDFCGYDAYFDFSNLLMLPHFHQMPMVDWYMWWMGLEPEECPQVHKRNQLYLEESILRDMRQRLDALPQGKKVFFNPLASVPLRTFPEELRADFALRLLEREPGLRLIVNTPLGMHHERLTVLEESLSLEQYQALIASVDGIIGMNTYSTHVADATATPCVQLCAVLPPSFLPYYPLMASINVPEYENLPGYLLAKVDDEAWPGMQQAYHDAWAQLDADKVFEALEGCMQDKLSGAVAANICTTGSQGHCYLLDVSTMAQGPMLPHLVPHEAWTEASSEVAALLDRYVKIGSGVVAVGLRDYALVNLFAGKIFHNSLTLCETCDGVVRSLMHHCQRYALHHVRVLTALPAEHMGMRPVPQLDVGAEVMPPYVGNMRREHEVVELPLDNLNLRLDVLVVQPPYDLGQVLEGARASLGKYGTCVLCGPIPRTRLADAVQALVNCGYTAHGKSLTSKDMPSQEAFYFVLGLPSAHKNGTPQGYAPIFVQEELEPLLA